VTARRSPNERLAVLEQKVSHMEAELGRMSAKVDEMHAVLMQARGVRWDHRGRRPGGLSRRPLALGDCAGVRRRRLRLNAAPLGPTWTGSKSCSAAGSYCAVS
jgi:hypothetical protein